MGSVQILHERLLQFTCPHCGKSNQKRGKLSLTLVRCECGMNYSVSEYQLEGKVRQRHRVDN